jgi:hypothetical protein
MKSGKMADAHHTNVMRELRPPRRDQEIRGPHRAQRTGPGRSHWSRLVGPVALAAWRPVRSSEHERALRSSVALPVPAAWRVAVALAVWLGATIGLEALSMTAARAAEEAEEANADSLQLYTQGWTVDSIRISHAQAPGVRHLVASGRIAAPVRDVWEVVSRPPREGQWWPGIKEATIERVEADTQVVRYTLSVPFYRDRHYELRSVADQREGRFLFEMVPGYGNVRAINGYWQVSALSDSLTRVNYVLDTDPGVSLVPRFIVNWATRRAVPRTFAFLARKARVLERTASR